MHKNIGISFDMKEILNARPKKKNPYQGITYLCKQDKNLDMFLAYWRDRGKCKRGHHLFDEVWNGEDHYLHCDACEMVVNISSIDTSYMTD